MKFAGFGLICLQNSFLPTLKTQHQLFLKTKNILWWLLELWKMLMELCTIKCNMKRQEAQKESSIRNQGCASCVTTMKVLEGSWDFTAPLVTFHYAVQPGLSLREIVSNSMLKEFGVSLEQHRLHDNGVFLLLLATNACTWIKQPFSPPI